MGTELGWAVERVLEVADKQNLLLRELVDEARGLEALEGDLRAVAKGLGDMAEQPDGPPYLDLVPSLPTNSAPDHPYLVGRGWAWWPLRDLLDVEGVTIHHTLSHSPQAMAEYCSNPRSEGGKGLPSIQYHYWISAEDGCPIYRCAKPEWALWHDHTGAHPKTLSVGIAGHLHLYRPPDEQIEAAARLVRWMMGFFEVELPGVRGHRDLYSTVCPGWCEEASGLWRDDFYAAVEGARY